VRTGAAPHATAARGSSARSRRPVVPEGAELRASGAVLLPLTPRQKMRTEFWQSVAPPSASSQGSAHQWQQGLVERVKQRVALREHASNASANHAARARSRRESARSASRAPGLDIAAPYRDPHMSNSNALDVMALGPLEPEAEGPQSTLELRQAECDRWRDEKTKLMLQVRRQC